MKARVSYELTEHLLVFMMFFLCSVYCVLYVSECVTFALLQLSRQFEECRREKDSMVLRYAQAEKKNLELEQRCERLEQQLMKQGRERDVAVTRWQAVKAENSHATQCLEARVCTTKFRPMTA